MAFEHGYWRGATHRLRPRYRRFPLAWIRPASHSLLHEGLPQSELSSLTGSGREGTVDAALSGNIRLPKTGKAVLVVITDGEGMWAGETVLKSWDSGYSHGP